MSTDTVSGSQNTSSKRRITIISGALVVALLLFAGIWPKVGRHKEAIAIASAAENAVPMVVVRQAKTAPGTSDLMLPGNTEAINVARIYARANGYIRERMVDIGSPVKTGQVLAIIESPEVDQELAQARANLENSRAAVEQARANLEQSNAGVVQSHALVEQAKANEEIAATTDRRWTRLVDRGVIPKQSGDERRSAYLARQAETAAAIAALKTSEAMVISRTADLRAAGAGVEAQAANVKRLERLQGFERVMAPFDGVVTERKVERGDLVSAGSGSDRNLFTVAQANVLRIQVNVPQSYAVDLKQGQAADIIVRERPGQAFTGKVARTAEALNANSRTLLSEVQVDNRNGSLLPGMYAQVKFTLPRTHNVVIISGDALVVNSKGTFAVVVGQNKHIKYVPVTVGRDLGTEVEVLSGLNGGEQVITNPPDTLADGQQVEILPNKPPEKKG